MCSGPSKQEKDAQAAQAAFSKQMQTIFSQAFAQDQQLVQFMTSQLEPMITNPQGFTPAEMSQLQSSLTTNVGQQYLQQAQNLNRQFATRNMAGLPSGVQAQLQTNLAGQASAAQAGGENQIQLQNAQLAQQRQMQALGMLGSQVASLQNAVPASGGLFNQSNSAAFQQAKTMSEQGFGWGNLLSGVVNAGLGFATGGLSNLTQGMNFFGGPTGGGGGGGQVSPYGVGPDGTYSGVG